MGSLPSARLSDKDLKQRFSFDLIISDYHWLSAAQNGKGGQNRCFAAVVFALLHLESES